VGEAVGDVDCADGAKLGPLGANVGATVTVGCIVGPALGHKLGGGDT